MPEIMNILDGLAAQSTQMDKDKVEALGAYLKKYITLRPGAPHVHGCDGSFSMTVSWLQEQYPEADFMCHLAWLVTQGALCDCGVLINVVRKEVE